ncbi:MAG TPA: hypothetical protein VGT24_00365 [Candidatus Acidoferrales bacterium]|nr:hypothetical protein [Candidatus Acidoferrales bacterium]
MLKHRAWAVLAYPEIRGVYLEMRRAGRGKFVAAGVVLAALMFLPFAGAQTRQPDGQANKPQADKPESSAPADQELDGWGRPITKLPKGWKAAPAPKHDLSGIWDPGMTGIQMFGAKAMPEDGKPEHQLPYTPMGLEALKRTKPNNGPRGVLPGQTNDPVFKYGDPQGTPREDLYELRSVQIFQTPLSVALLYQWGRVWRMIWTDGREVPKDPEPRWFGYSVGKWVDDTTLVVETTGINDTTWVDRAGRPHSADLRVEERFHRPDHDHLELTVTIDDPVMYTRPWVALDRFVFDLQPPTFDVREMIWSPSEYEEYNKLMGNTAGDKENQ